MAGVGLEKGDEEKSGNNHPEKEKFVWHLVNNDRSEVT